MVHHLQESNGTQGKLSKLRGGEKKMAIEIKRGCGYRKVGGIYLVGDGLSAVCDRLPYPLEVCRVCGAGIKPSRGIQWLDGKEFFGGNCKDFMRGLSNPDNCHGFECPICYSDGLGKTGLMWVGEKFYPTVESFVLEAEKQGVSKRISQIPRDIEIGKTWILLAHTKGKNKRRVIKGSTGKVEEITWVSAIFYAFKPKQIEMIVTDQIAEEELDKLQKRGITPVVVPHNDPDHNPKGKGDQVESPEFEIV